MLQNFIHRLLERRHFWRHATFSEIAELYASRTLRLLALRMTTTFTAIYLYQLGYSVLFIVLFLAAFFAAKAVFAYFGALIASHAGPKHGILVSNITGAIAMVLLVLVPTYGLLALVPWAVILAFSQVTFELCYIINFSKVKHPENAGKELGYMNILEKVATGISPLIGGLLALFFGPQVTMVVSAVLFLLAALPLLQTGEQVETHHKFSFDGLSWNMFRSNVFAQASVGYDTFATNSAWVLFLTVIIFAGGGNEIYAQVGALLSVTLLMAIAASYSFGVLIDRKRGGELLRISAVLNSLVHLVRPLTATPFNVALVNAANELATTGFTMAFTRGTFDAADDSGHRVAYLYLMEVVMNLGTVLGALSLGLLLSFLDDSTALHVFYFVAAIVVLGIATPKFSIYRR